jgi:hypothetical protein
MDIERKIKINPDGSGKEILTMTIGKEFFDVFISTASLMNSSKAKTFIDSLYSDDIYKSQFRKTLNSIEGLHLINVDSRTNPDSSKTIETEYSFEDIKYIGNKLNYSYVYQNKTDDSDLTADISFKDEGNKVIFIYDVKPSKTKYNSYKELAAPFFKNNKVIYNIDFPYDISSSNATYKNGRNLIWEFDTGDLISNANGFRLEAIMKK